MTEIEDELAGIEDEDNFDDPDEDVVDSLDCDGGFDEVGVIVNSPPPMFMVVDWE